MTDTDRTVDETIAHIQDTIVTIPGYGTGARKELKDAEKRNRQLLEQHEDYYTEQTAAIAWIKGEQARLDDELADRVVLQRDARLAVKQYQDRFGIKGAS